VVKSLIRSGINSEVGGGGGCGSMIKSKKKGSLVRAGTVNWGRTKFAHEQESDNEMNSSI